MYKRLKSAHKHFNHSEQKWSEKQFVRNTVKMIFAQWK